MPGARWKPPLAVPLEARLRGVEWKSSEIHRSHGHLTMLITKQLPQRQWLDNCINTVRRLTPVSIEQLNRLHFKGLALGAFRSSKLDRLRSSTSFAPYPRLPSEDSPSNLAGP